MSLSVSHQGWALLLSLAMGVGIGLVYDILRPARRHSGAALARLLDALFAVTAAAALFFFAMASGNGRLGTWELAAALVGNAEAHPPKSRDQREPALAGSS